MTFGRRVTKEELLAIWRRDMDSEYTEPLERELEGRGLDVIAGLAAVFERVSDAVQSSTQSFYLKPHSAQLDSPASGEEVAVGNIDIYRRLLLGGDINLLAGDVLVVRWQDTEGEWVDGVELELLANVTIPPAVEGPTSASVRALRPGAQGNTPAGRVAVFVQRGRATVPLFSAALGTIGDTAEVGGDVPDMFTEDMVGRYFRFTDTANASLPAYRIASFTAAVPATSPNLITLDRFDYDETTVAGNDGLVIEIADLGIDAVIVDPLSGGRHGELDMLAAERGQGRAAGEPDETLRTRVCALSDVVSPDAIVRTVSAILAPLGVPFQLIEIGTYEGRGFVLDYDAFDDPTAFAHGRFFYGAHGQPWSIFGFILLIDGSALPLDEAPVINAIRNVVNSIKADGMPWAMVFEPPIP